ncbi:MAG: CHAT domain-containing protein [Polaribacter sp.]
MSFKSKIFFGLFVILFGFNSHSLFAQTKTSNSIIKQLSELYFLNKADSVISVSNKALKDLKSTNSKDSLLFAKIYLYQFMGLHKTNKSIKNISSLDKGVLFCPNSNTGDSLKAVFYNKKAYLESEIGSSIKSYKDITNSLKLLESLPNPSFGGLMGAYLLLSNHHAYYGNFEKAKYYMRLAENVYAKNKVEIDKNTWELNGNHHRLGVIAKYRKVYLFYSSKNSKDSLAILNTMKSLENMHNQPDFHKEERIYYSTALNHIGDWFISHKHDSLTTQKDVATGLQYLLKTLDLVENKNYLGTPWAIKYNIAKGFIRGNQLEKADSTMAVLFRGISKSDGRLPFFLAQKAQIKAKKKQKDSALFYFYKSIEKIHKGKATLHKNYSNFTPSKSYNHTNLLIRIGEELNYYYKKDTLIQKKVNKMYLLALQQFENSYLDINFNPKQNNELRKIIQGILNDKKTGFIDHNILQKTILNKFETFKSKIAWKKFYENRYTNSLPNLDAVKNRQLELASLLSSAKLNQNIEQQDSINRLLEKHQINKEKLFPQLDLFSDFTFSIEDLQQKLTGKDLVLKYILLNDELAIYQISKNNFKVDVLKWTKKTQEKLTEFIKETHNQNYNSELASKFGQLLFPKIDKNISNIIINPDGILYKLPFEILKTKNKLTTEIYNIRYTSNLGFIEPKIQESSFLNDVHIYAPNYVNTTTKSDIRGSISFLEGANKEAKTISKLFPSKLYNQQNLTKSKFIKTASKAKILHLAMHAEVNKDFPEFSRLLFSNNLENEEDHLYLEELYGISLGADLAILSACNTGGGLEKNGSLASFQRAFTFAGVSATVASLWEVPDASTQKIMVLFYKNLKAGQTKSEALKNAKITYRKENTNSKLSAPYYWAGFVVYGSDATIVDKTSSVIFYLIIPIIMVFFVVLFFRRRTKNTMN